MTRPDPLAERALRLFDFLTEVQQLKNRPVTDVESYERVLWFADFPAHPSIRVTGFDADTGAEDIVATVDRVAEIPPPEPPLALKGLLLGELTTPREAPRLNEDKRDTQPDHEWRRLSESYDTWIDRWFDWAEREEADRPVRELYQRLFRTRIQAVGEADQLELVIGLGLLTWDPDTGPIRRHFLTTTASIEFDDLSGRLRVVLDQTTEALRCEIDMVDPGLFADPQRLRDIRELARSDAHPLDREHVGDIVSRLVHVLDPAGGYDDVDTRVAPGPRAFATLAPALILRKRSRRNLTEIYQTIIEQIRDTGIVPGGLRPLFDPDHDPALPAPSGDGAIVQVDDEMFLPLPVNDVQLRILERVDTQAQTLVQGPPGTGKTHTAAALLSHLLAQGKRVLVTAQTDRALHEVRDKLPEAIRDLAVAVVGNGRAEMAALKASAERIGDRINDHDPLEIKATVDRCLEAIDRLRRERAVLRGQLVEARKAEVWEHERPGYRGTLAAIAQQHGADRDRHGWIDGLGGGQDAAPLNNDEIGEWYRLVSDSGLGAESTDVIEAAGRLVPTTELATSEDFAALVAAERESEGRADHYAELRDHPAQQGIAALSAADRRPLRDVVIALAEDIEGFRSRRETWIAVALSDVLQGREKIWTARHTELRSLAEDAIPLVSGLGPRTTVTATGELGPLIALAKAVSDHLAAGGKVKTNADGTVKYGLATAGIVKQARALFDNVRVNGLPPATADGLALFRAWAEATGVLDALDRAWPQSVEIPDEDTLSERLQWHLAEIEQLTALLNFGDRLAATKRDLPGLGVKAPDWTDLDAVATWAEVVDAVDAGERLEAARLPLAALERAVNDRAGFGDAANATLALLAAIRARDTAGYVTAQTRTLHLHEVASRLARRDELDAALTVGAPGLRRVIEASPVADWQSRLSSFTQAWNWASTGSWIAELESVDVNALRARADRVDTSLRGQVEKLAATRAWSYAASPERVDGRTRQALINYVQLFRRDGRGMGKYSAGRQVNMQSALDRCRTAVPVWIMPIHRIADQLRVAPDMFDVVVVDEASQAGLEAVFLQYLAPRIVIIGDDKQVSPAAVGTVEQQLIDLAHRHLPDMQDRSAWSDPKHSLFDEANLRFREKLTLREHRRCVPEIIGFSNRIAYEPEGIRLIPVRQYGADRLDPVIPVHVPDGYTRGTRGKVNPPEADAIVDQIVKCIADPRYDGKTFGVISLLGQAADQAKYIEGKLLEAIGPKEWEARRLRCGIAPDFQGAERDVMFLSMVATVEPDVRYRPLTTLEFVQRFNVAASRAKDQMWVFHSLRLEELTNQEDLRRRLLEYAYEVRARTEVEGLASPAVPENERVEPFDSLFEQRVHNRIRDRGYRVEPQIEALGYRIDLVVVGAKAKLAVECDGDHWHGPERYQDDLRRQRDLERCGWRFFRIRESRFYLDEAAVLDELVERLRELEIEPIGSASFPRPAPEPVTAEAAPRALPVKPEPTREPEPVMKPSVIREPEHPVEEPTKARPPTVVRVATPIAERAVAPAPSALDGRLEPYQRYTGTRPPLAGPVLPGVLIEGLMSIVAVEGPILGSHLIRTYRIATGAAQTGRLMRESLNKAIVGALKRGLAMEDPLKTSLIDHRTFRLPGQPGVRLRELGPRNLYDVPHMELATVMALCAEKTGWRANEPLFREVLAMYGLERLTDKVEDHLRIVKPLARELGD
ncbi:hypothetical protein Afil01_42730 [Actinorhabdospora filicis]|uniref:AAA domain-containing protein n=1 Tax=Actinorhabdospora filicis TaxID=1785913 RepID=A0A9W6SRL3_9ACTN|nr:AAA domain-containing protein [Actinorhabdospora filicis]GLZ79466.1 hypothetical protein Afil01_42730 [Actinorhabdospora filicis]